MTHNLENFKTTCESYSKELKRPQDSGDVNFESNQVQKISALMFKFATLKVKMYRAPKGFKKEKFFIPCKDGSILHCYSIEKNTGSKNKPAILYLHGGGWISPLQTVIFDNAVVYANELDCKVIMPE